MAKKKTKKKVKKAGRVCKKKKATRCAKKKVTKKKETPVKKVSGKAAGVSLEEIGFVTHYFPHVEAAVVKLTKGTLTLGDRIVIKGHTTDFKEKIASMQLDRVPITTAEIGQEIGLKVKSRVREHDGVYKVAGKIAGQK